MDKLLASGDGVQGFGFMDLLKQEEPQQPAQQQTVQPRLGSLAQPGPGERGECCAACCRLLGLRLRLSASWWAAGQRSFAPLPKRRFWRCGHSRRTVGRPHARTAAATAGSAVCFPGRLCCARWRHSPAALGRPDRRPGPAAAAATATAVEPARRVRRAAGPAAAATAAAAAASVGGPGRHAAWQQPAILLDGQPGGTGARCWVLRNHPWGQWGGVPACLPVLLP